MIGIQQARPPYVEFKQRPVHDPVKSNELGYRVTKDVDFAYIMQAGSRDCLEIKATDWLESIKRKGIDASHDAYPQDWIDGFFKKYEAWKAGQEAPLNGTSVREWPLLSPAQAQNFIALRIMTIEDVADMTEEAMQRFGMGSRELREKAREWVKGKEVSSLAMQENVELKKQIEALTARLTELENKPKRGRPKKV